MPERLLPTDRAASHTMLSFTRDHQDALAAHFNASLSSGLAGSDISQTGVSGARWYWRVLQWDTAYFGLPFIRIECCTWDGAATEPTRVLVEALQGLLEDIARSHDRVYVFTDIPAEDTLPIAALGRCGFRLVETRLTYYRTGEGAFAAPPQPVRPATLDDIPHLRDVAMRARNPFDRYHADEFFGQAVADRYIATYVEEAVRGLADVVLVPDPDDGAPPGAFFALDLTEPPECPLGEAHECQLGIATARIPLVAVAPERRGWHIRLLTAATRSALDRGVDLVYMTTQATNRAVIRNCERTGYHLGRTSHVLTWTRGTIK